MSETVGTPDLDMAGVVFRPMEQTESDLILFKRAFESHGSARSLELLRWQYLEPPAGKVFVDLAVVPGAEPRLAAVYATFPVVMRANGAQVVGVQSLDTLTDEAFRGKGLFVRMASALYSRARAGGVGLVYGFPNGNSAHGFFKRLSWCPLDPVPWLLKPLRASYVLRKLRIPSALARVLDIPLTLRMRPRLPSNQEFRSIDTVGSEFDAVWDRFSRGLLWTVERDASYMRWRIRRPGSDYQVIGLYEGGELVGWAAVGTAGGPGVLVGTLMDLVYDPSRPALGKALMAQVVRHLYIAGCAVIWAWNFKHSPNHEAIRNAGFMRAPARLQQETHMGARAIAAPADGISERESWYISLFDSDTN